jgi:hypothetical protein
MKKYLLIAAVIVVSALGACSETERAQNEARYNDKPADILCQGYSGVLVDTRTTGRIEFDATGRIDFVDAKTGRLTKTEGECVVTYVP